MAAAHAQRERSSDENSSTRSAAAILDDLMIWMDLDGLISPTKMRNKKKNTPNPSKNINRIQISPVQ
jgi:hypothetical protein